jgi:hypothetical protein
VRLSRCGVRDHINDRKNDRWRSYRFYRALRWLKSPVRYICEIFGDPRFSSFSTQSARNGHRDCLFASPSRIQCNFQGAYEGSIPFARSTFCPQL